MKLFFTLFSFFCFSAAFSQDLTGIWRGSFTDMVRTRDAEGNPITLPGSHYKYEVQIAQNGSNFQGVTYSYLTTVFYGKATARGTVNRKNGKVLLEELKLVDVKMSQGSGACAMTLFLQYSKSGKEEFLEGSFTAMNVEDSTRCPGGKVFLRKVPVSDFYKEPIVAQREKEIASEKRKEELAAERKKTTAPAPRTARTTPPPPASSKPLVRRNNKPAPQKPVPEPSLQSSFVKADTAEAPPEVPASISRRNIPVATPEVIRSRDNELVRTIVTRDHDVTIRIYDNGTIDNDSISLFVDKKLVISHARLTEKPITLKLQLDNTNSTHEVTLVADNLGDIPPNTSLMVVNTDGQEYEVHITSTEQKNAVVIFKLAPR